MIRYKISKRELEKRVDALRPSWRERARARTEAFRLAGKYDNKEKPIWSEIKQVFIDLQRNKCAFCERSLESKKEYDVEHFRPKSSVKPWPVPKALQDAGVTVNQGRIKDSGYHLLPYHLLNYSLACAKCNSELKSDYFPIRGKRIPNGDNPANLLKDEQAWLIFPIGPIDENPEDLISFHGLFPQATNRLGSIGHGRALVTIAFFGLDNRNQRRELFRGRADVIAKLGLALRSQQDTGASAKMKDSCKKLIAYHQSSAALHSNCGRSYVRLWHEDEKKAEHIFHDAVEFLNSISPSDD